MKKIFFITLLIAVISNGKGQQQITHTAAKENLSCNYDCTILDIPELNNNPLAILFVTPSSEKGGNLNQHPIGAYYFKEKWHIFNLDSRPIPVGSKFTVTYFTDPDEKHFQYSFKREDIQPDGSALIDHPSLNGNPGAKFTSFPRWDPNSAGGITNRDEIKTEYNAAAGKWAFSNKNQKPLYSRVTYNISVEDAGNANTKIVTPRTSVQIKELDVVPDTTSRPCNCPASLPPNGQARGDLAGSYPDPMVAKLLNRPLSNTPPATGQILKWNGSEWHPANEASGNNNAPAYTAGLGITLSGTQFSANSTQPMWNANQLVGREIMTTQPTVGQVLKWGGGSWYPADDNVGTGGTGNGWNLNGANISNINSGNVGIGNNNPAYQLDVNNRMRIRSGGNNSASAGLWLNNIANTQEAAFIGMEDDTHVGFYGKSSAGWKFSMNTQTGALKINGTEGTAGQVLMSNGAGTAPTWAPPASTGATGIKTYYKYNQIPGGLEEEVFNSEERIHSLCGIVITVTVPSTLAISASCLASTACPSFGSCEFDMNFYYKVNNTPGVVFRNYGQHIITATICNHLYDVAPGTYTIDFFTKKAFPTSLNYSIGGIYATVMVLPK